MQGDIMNETDNLENALSPCDAPNDRSLTNDAES